MISVASVPTGHAYVAHLRVPGDLADVAVVRLPDPVPPDALTAEQWWPPRWLEPEYVVSQQDTFDLIHLHFGFEHYSTDELTSLVTVLRGLGKPLVFTVHDLHNPHFADDTAHLAQLDVLIPAADALITLTASAADEIERRWSRSATVIAHPHVAPLHLIGMARRPREEFVVGLHAKSLRANLDPLTVVDTVIDAVRDLPTATVRIDLDSHVLDDAADASRRDVAHALLRRRAVRGVDVRVHPRFSDDQLWEYLSDIDVSVMPYRFGTHSGWLEACHDLGVTAVVADCGHHRSQQACRTFGFGARRFDPESLREALRSAYEMRDRPPQVSAAARRSQREQIAAAHERIYREVLDRRVGVAV
ncbi:glycosyltransferase family protein [Williamsia sterculiae]|uniref:Glycosyltransferase involved in cell wall bisynthesis n=1 Tax=Williamsia sterculiae TaxID=1344003 RepID=A0A1N7EPI2_9NOCA|nr:glycosyltransferase family 4 protein [Williamsia sterculiae]SIR90001.1 Glycosyltransferase involved in cell wall bisynthesis [Williamsia sterculiae]